MLDQDYMRRALRLAMNGAGKVNPNPLVGCVIVKDGRIIGEGWHTAFGKLHAEREALAACTEDPTGATAYVTLEPCCHTGKTPPCTEALIERGIARVVMGAPDPNPLVAGKGVAVLREAGIEVTEGVCVPECLAINAPFFHYIKTKRPYVILKYAMTMDGKIATRSGKSKWITGPEARRRVHEDRNRYAAIMVGVNTVIKDDPMLTCRLDEFAEIEASKPKKLKLDQMEEMLEEEIEADQALIDAEADGEGVTFRDCAANNPIRIVCDTNLRTPLNSKLVRTALEVPTYIATCVTDFDKQMPYRENDVEIIQVPMADGHVDMDVLMDKLGKLGIDSVIVEGGAEINWSVLSYEVVNKMQCYVAPKIFGGAKAPSPVAGFGVEAPDYAIMMGEPEVTKLGRDLLIECEVL